MYLNSLALQYLRLPHHYTTATPSVEPKEWRKAQSGRPAIIIIYLLRSLSLLTLVEHDSSSDGRNKPSPSHEA
jgi:hypothetical protein